MQRIEQATSDLSRQTSVSPGEEAAPEPDREGIRQDDAIHVVLCSAVGSSTCKPGTFFGEFKQEIAECAGARGKKLVWWLLEDGKTPRSCQSYLAQARATHCVLLAPRDAQLVPLLEDLGITWVAAFPRAYIDSKRLIFDSPLMVGLQLSHLFELGHRRIAYLDPVHELYANITALHRRETYYRLMAQQGIQVDPKWVVHGGYSEATLNAALETMFSTEPAPSALIAADPQLPTVCGFLQSRDMRIGRDCSVVATDDLPITAALQPTITSVHNSREQAAAMILGLLQELDAGREPHVPRYTTLSLTMRDSTGIAPDLALA